MAILGHSLWLKREGFRESTIDGSVASLKAIAKDSNLFDSESVKENIASRPVSEGTKEKLVQVYDRFCRQHEVKWVKPKYFRVEGLPQVPSESDIDQLIGALSKRVGTFLQFLKETGARAGEAWALRWVDIEPNNMVIINHPEKRSRPRGIRVSGRLTSLLNSLPQSCQFVFRFRDGSDFKSFARFFYKRRKQIAKNLANPRLLSVNFKSLRHFKATMEYHRTKDILHVKNLLGHKRIENTLVYTHLIDFESDEYVVKVASSIGDVTSLLEAGFEYVTDYEGMKILRKRK